MVFPRTAVVPAFLLFPLLVAAQGPRAVVDPNRFHFGKVVRGVVLTHDFLLRNEGSEALRVGRIVATPPLLVIGRPDRVNAGSAASIRVSIETAALSGPYEGEVVVTLDDPIVPEERLSFRGEVYPSIELSPPQALVLTSYRVETRRASVEIISHEPEPLRLLHLEHAQERIATETQALEDGRRYQLTVWLNPRAPAGKRTEIIRIATSSKNMPAIDLTVDTDIRDRVWVSPEALSFGDLPISLLREMPQVVRRLTREVTIHHPGTPVFQIRLHSNLPFVDVKCQPAGPDRYTATLRLLADRVQAGSISGILTVETNDPQFPRLTVPISGMIVDQ